MMLSIFFSFFAKWISSSRPRRLYSSFWSWQWARETAVIICLYGLELRDAT